MPENNCNQRVGYKPTKLEYVTNHPVFLRPSILKSSVIKEESNMLEIKNRRKATWGSLVIPASQIRMWKKKLFRHKRRRKYMSVTYLMDCVNDFNCSKNATGGQAEMVHRVKPKILLAEWELRYLGSFDQ